MTASTSPSKPPSKTFSPSLSFQVILFTLTLSFRPAPAVAAVNIYEGNGDQLTDSPILRRLGLHHNHVHRFLSCKACGHLLTGDWVAHVGEHLGKGKVSKGDEEAINALKGDQPMNTAGFVHGIQAIQGLKLLSGVFCRQCANFAGNQNSLADHVSMHHRGTKPEGEKCLFQHPLILGKNIRVS